MKQGTVEEIKRYERYKISLPYPRHPEQSMKLFEYCQGTIQFPGLFISNFNTRPDNFKSDFVVYRWVFNPYCMIFEIGPTKTIRGNELLRHMRNYIEECRIEDFNISALIKEYEDNMALTREYFVLTIDKNKEG